MMTKGIPKEEPQQTNEGIDADDHEVKMALSDLHKLEEYSPEVCPTCFTIL